jgi:hypothetical protein
MIKVLLILLILTISVSCGPLAAGICYTGCNFLWVTCVAAAGGVAGVTTGAGAIPAVLACNAGQGVCMSACVAALVTPTF